MTPQNFYKNNLSSLDDLDFKTVNRVGNDLLMAGSLMDFPVENLVGFNGPNGFFCYALQKLSEGGQWLLIASLAGSVKLAVGDLNVCEPIGLVCVQGSDWRSRESRVSTFGKAWAPMTAKGLGTIRSKNAHGELSPISRTIVTRGLEGVFYEYWVVLPCMPDSIKKKNGKAYMECESDVYVLNDTQQVAAVLNKKATWIVPDASGDFIFPEFC